MHRMALKARIWLLSVHGTTTRRQVTCMTIGLLLRLRYILGVAARRYNVLLLLVVSMYATTIAWTRIGVRVLVRLRRSRIDDLLLLGVLLAGVVRLRAYRPSSLHWRRPHSLLVRVRRSGCAGRPSKDVIEGLRYGSASVFRIAVVDALYQTLPTCDRSACLLWLVMAQLSIACTALSL